ncbi:CD59B glycoprotein [Epinephelus moara]|uniref:CD59B glycoprotein n=1 Tax=Epinephelus moara TaxID=300413 RepID=UPI00214E5079|nr:CD59B glycoprotein [Epinephelus moara]
MTGQSMSGYKRGRGDENVSVIVRSRHRRISKAAALNRTMKLLVLALTITLLFTAGEALNCHRCVSKTAGGTCELSEEACKPGKDACAAVRFLRAPNGQYQKCMALEDCELLKLNAYIDVNCCTGDMCNTF